MLDVTIIRRTAKPVASMERFADALERSVVEPGLRIRSGSTGAGSHQTRAKLRSHLNQWVERPWKLRRLSGDVFHLVDHSDAHLLRVLPAGRTVVTCHDLLLLRAASRDLDIAGPAWWTARFRWTISHLPRAGAIVCPSQATRADVLRYCDVSPERVHVVPQGVGRHFRPLHPQARKAVRQSLDVKGRRVMLHVGSGSSYKNGPATLHVLAALVDAGVDALLIRVGALSEAEIDLAHRLSVESRVLQQGQVSEARLVELYGAADVFLFPSKAEGFGWPVLEAMACGLPVVTSTAPALRELTEGAARHADAGNVDDLAEQVTNVLGDPEGAHRLRTLGLARAATYTWERTQLSYAEIYWSLAGDPSRRGRAWAR